MNIRALTRVVLISIVAAVVAAPRVESAVTKKTAERRATVDVLFSLQASNTDYELGIRALEAANLDFDIATAVRRRDRRLIGMMGYSLEVPGVDGVPPGGPPPGYRIIIVKGTSDAGSGPKARCESLLSRYAERYNKTLLKRGSAAEQ
jgi:hypothetical protein